MSDLTFLFSCMHMIVQCCAGGWRNGLLFDPLQKYGNFSYADVMLYPLAAALAAAADADTKIYMAMQVRSPSEAYFVLNGLPASPRDSACLRGSSLSSASSKASAAVQGEMSATVFYFPGSYVKLIPDLKQRLSAGQASASNIRIGVSTNFDKLCGCVLQACIPSFLPLLPPSL